MFKRIRIFIVGGGILAAAFWLAFSMSPGFRVLYNSVYFKIWKISRFYVSLPLVKDEAPGVGPGDKPIEVPDPNHFSFAVLGDTQMFYLPDSEGGFQKAVAQIEKMKPDLVMTVGDLVETCGSERYCMNYKEWKNITKPILPITYEVVGNHDRVVDNVDDEERAVADKAWRNYFNLPTNGPSDYGEMVYSFDVGNSHFVVLDTEKPKEHKIGSDQLAWLENDLANNKKDNTFVFFHEPAFPMSYKIGQSLDAFPKDRDALWAILDRYNVTAVFNGHEHIYSRQTIEADDFPGAKNEINQFIIGNTDADEKQAVSISNRVDYYHKGHDFIIVEVNGKEITVKLFSVDGNLVDSFTFSK